MNYIKKIIKKKQKGKIQEYIDMIAGLKNEGNISKLGFKAGKIEQKIEDEKKIEKEIKGELRAALYYKWREQIDNIIEGIK